MILKDELTLENREDQIGQQRWRKHYSLWERKDISGKESMQIIPEFVLTVAGLGLTSVEQDSCP